MKTFLRIAAVAVAALFVLALFYSPHFQVKSVRVRGARTLPVERVLFYAQDLVGKPAVYPPLRAVRQRIAAIPEIESVRFGFLPPLRMTVHVTERKPYFLVEKKPQKAGKKPPSVPTFWVVDRNGVVFGTAHERLPDLNLVQMTTNREWRLGDRLESGDMAKIEEAFTVARRTGVPSPERFFYDHGFLSLRLLDRTLVRLGNDQWARKLRRVHRAVVFLHRTGQVAEYLDFTSLDVPTWKAKKVNL
jgi:hypothetical protein